MVSQPVADVPGFSLHHHHIKTVSRVQREREWVEAMWSKMFFWSQSAQTSQTLWKDIRKSNKHCMQPGSAEWHLPISILDQAAGTDYATGKSNKANVLMSLQLFLLDYFSHHRETWGQGQLRASLWRYYCALVCLVIPYSTLNSILMTSMYIFACRETV